MLASVNGRSDTSHGADENGRGDWPTETPWNDRGAKHVVYSGGLHVELLRSKRRPSTITRLHVELYDRITRLHVEL